MRRRLLAGAQDLAVEAQDRRSLDEVSQGGHLDGAARSWTQAVRCSTTRPKLGVIYGEMAITYETGVSTCDC